MQKSRDRAVWRVAWGWVVRGMIGVVGVSGVAEPGVGEGVSVEGEGREAQAWRGVTQDWSFCDVGPVGLRADAWFGVGLREGDVVLPAGVGAWDPRVRFAEQRLRALAADRAWAEPATRVNLRRELGEFERGVTRFPETVHEIGGVMLAMPELRLRGLRAFEPGQPGYRVGVGPGRVSRGGAGDIPGGGAGDGAGAFPGAGAAVFEMGEDIRVYYYAQTFDGGVEGEGLGQPRLALPDGLRRVAPARLRAHGIRIDDDAVWRVWRGIQGEPAGRLSEGHVTLLADEPGVYRLGLAALGLEALPGDEGFEEVVFEVVRPLRLGGGVEGGEIDGKVDGQVGVGYWAGKVVEQAVAARVLTWSMPWGARLNMGEGVGLDREPMRGQLRFWPDPEHCGWAGDDPAQSGQLIVSVEATGAVADGARLEAEVFGQAVSFAVSDRSRRVVSGSILTDGVQWYLEEHGRGRAGGMLHVWQRFELPEADPLPEEWVAALKAAAERSPAIEDHRLVDGLGWVQFGRLERVWRDEDGFVYLHVVHYFPQVPAVPMEVDLNEWTVPLPGIEYGRGMVQLPMAVADAGGRN